MIYITGDTHGSFQRLYWFAEDHPELTKDDYMIICGDFGGIWSRKDYKKDWWEEEEKELDGLDELPFTTLFVDGNHENFDRLAEYPIKEEWHGGKVHEIRPSVLHLMRGEAFDIEGKKFFAFGGASCHDIKDGILDPADYDDWELEAEKWYYDFREFRIKGYSWWPEELPTEEEKINGVTNLQDKCLWSVDYVITHCPPASVVALLGNGAYEQDHLTEYLEKIRSHLNYKHWYCGHFHMNRDVNERDHVRYGKIERIV